MFKMLKYWFKNWLDDFESGLFYNQTENEAIKKFLDKSYESYK